MGFQDRDYSRQSLPNGGFGYFETWSVTTWLIVANVVVFVVDLILRRLAAIDEPTPWFAAAQMSVIGQWGYFSLQKAIYELQIWRFISFQFLHSSLMHLAGNMLGLYFFGPIVEAHFLPRRFLAFYLLCGSAGALSYLLLVLSHAITAAQWTPLVGASAGIFGLLVAAAMIAPHVQLFMFYGMFPVTVRGLAIFSMAIALYVVLESGHNNGGEAAHLGGGLLGFLLMKNQRWLSVFHLARGRESAAAASGPRRRRSRMFQKDWSKDFNR